MEALYEQLLDYLTFRVECLDGTGNTVKSDVDAIQDWFAGHSIHSDAKNYLPIKKFFQAVKLYRPGKNHTTRTLRDDEVAQMLALIPGNEIKDIVMRVALLISLQGGLRIAKYTAPSNLKNVTNSRKVIIFYKG